MAITKTKATNLPCHNSAPSWQANRMKTTVGARTQQVILKRATLIELQETK